MVTVMTSTEHSSRSFRETALQVAADANGGYIDRKIVQIVNAALDACEEHYAIREKDETAVAQLSELTFAVQHNPNCPSPWLVRLPGSSGAIDMKPYGDGIGLVRNQTSDILGFGKTFEDAAKSALARKAERSISSNADGSKP